MNKADWRHWKREYEGKLQEAKNKLRLIQQSLKGTANDKNMNDKDRNYFLKQHGYYAERQQQEIYIINHTILMINKEIWRD